MDVEVWLPDGIYSKVSEAVRNKATRLNMKSPDHLLLNIRAVAGPGPARDTDFAGEIREEGAREGSFPTLASMRVQGHW